LATREIENLFTGIVERVKTLDPENTRKWFDDLSVGYFNGGSLRVNCPDESIAQYLEDKCKSTFTQAAQQASGYLVSVDFSAAQTSKDTTEEIDISGLKLHPDYTFDNFVVGPSNRLAHASCIAISHSPGNTYNPLFIYGNSGLGKTHLLHAVCFETKRKNSNAVIRYHSCEDFVNRFIRAIERGDLVRPWKNPVRDVRPRRNKVSLQGYIVERMNEDEVLAEHQVVYLDKGVSNGIEEGNRLFVIRRMDPSGYNDGLDQDDLPYEKIGELIILSAGHSSSVAMVAHSLTGLKIGDKVVMEKNY